MLNVTVSSIEQPAPSLFLLRLAGAGGMKFRAGQFVGVVPLLEAEQEGASLRTGLYCIASGEGDEPLELLVEERKGPLSQWICGRKPGDTLTLDGPAGNFVLADPEARTQIFLGSRAGLGPLRAMILTLTKAAPQQHCHLFLGARGSAELIFDSQWRALEARCDKFHYHPVVQPTAENPFFGKNQDPADELIKKMVHRTGHDLYLAGFNHDVDPMRAKLEAAGFEKDRIRVERFG